MNFYREATALDMKKMRDFYYESIPTSVMKQLEAGEDITAEMVDLTVALHKVAQYDAYVTLINYKKFIKAETDFNLLKTVYTDY